MNMSLLEVAMCEQCRSGHFQSEGWGWGKIFEDWGVGEKMLGLGGSQFVRGGNFAGGSVPHYIPWLFQISHNCVPECTLQAKFLSKHI